LDDGPDRIRGKTAWSYGVTGYPTTIIIDKKGRVYLNRSAEDSVSFGKEAREIADELKVPWRIDEGVLKEESLLRLRQIHQRWLEKKIDAALSGTAIARRLFASSTHASMCHQVHCDTLTGKWACMLQNDRETRGQYLRHKPAAAILAAAQFPSSGIACLVNLI